MHSGLYRHDQQYQNTGHVERYAGIGFVGYDSAGDRSDNGGNADNGFIGCDIF